MFLGTVKICELVRLTEGHVDCLGTNYCDREFDKSSVE